MSFCDFLELGKLGLVFNTLGTVAIAFSIGAKKDGAYDGAPGDNGNPFAYFKSPTLFYGGLVAIIAGFVLQLFS